MELTEEQKQEIKQQFKVRRTRQLCMAVPIFVLMIATIILEDQLETMELPVPEQVLFGAFIGLIVVVLVLSFRNWRCPQCDKYLGKNANPKFCPKCGVELQ